MMIARKNMRPKPVALIMLEGWGVAPASAGNKLIGSAPYFSHLAEHYPVCVLSASGEAIGLPVGMAGNGEVGHSVIGSGRLFFNAQQVIDEKIKNDSFASGKEFIKLGELAKTENSFHLIGLISSSELEASIKHLENLIIFLTKQGAKQIYLHLILDGRETKKNSGKKLIEDLSDFLAKYSNCHIASLVGRLYALDEKNNFSRTAKAVKLFISGEGNVYASAQDAFKQIYDKKIFDEEFPPIAIKNQIGNSVRIEDHDVVILWNHTGQGICQLANYLAVNYPAIKLVTLTDYGLTNQPLILFPEPGLGDSLSKVFSEAKLKQLKIAESAGFPNVVKAFDAYSPNFFEGVDKKLIPTTIGSSLVDSITETIKETQRLFVEAVQKSAYDLIIVTFAQIDLMSHNPERADLTSVIKTFDDNIKLMIEAIASSGGVAVIVGTHGFAEQTVDSVAEKEIFSHSLNLVPCYLVGKRFEGYNLGWPEAVGGDLSLLKPIGSLVDIAPTILSLALLPIPQSMVGHSLI